MAWATNQQPPAQDGYLVQQQLLSSLFRQQLDFIQDPATRKIVVVGRQGGKTTAVKYYLITTALSQSGINVVYVSLIRDTVKQIMMRELEQTLIQHNIAYSVNNQELFIKLFNGSIIYFKACSNVNHVHRVARGLGYALIVVDEAGYFPNSLMKSLMIDGLEPTLLRYGGKGVICLVCTATDEFGYFYDQWKNPEWKRFFWTIHDNPGIPNVEVQLEAIKRRNKWTDQTPTYRKEYLGQFVTDKSGLVYGYYNPSVNDYEYLPPGKYEYSMGVDFGIVDSTAITICAFQATSKQIYLIDEFTISEAAPSKVADIIKGFIERYDPVSIACDTQGQGKAFQEEYNAKYSILLPAADKTNKTQYINFLNDDVIGGLIKIKKEAKLLEEWQKLDWRITETKKYENPAAINHLSDSFLYNIRALKKYWVDELPPEKDPLRINELEELREKRHTVIKNQIEEQNKLESNWEWK